jgi:putative hemolysin
MRTLFKLTLFILLATILYSACSSNKQEPTDKPIPSSAPADKALGLPNPASVNCVEKGGKLELQDRGELGQIGVCVFENNYQCEEWAMFRDECPVGGVDVKGYATQAAVYCVIGGGEYAATGSTGATDEQGSCTFKNGTSCDVWEYFNGKCYPNQ